MRGKCLGLCTSKDEFVNCENIISLLSPDPLLKLLANSLICQKWLTINNDGIYFAVSHHNSDWAILIYWVLDNSLHNGFLIVQTILLELMQVSDQWAREHESLTKQHLIQKQVALFELKGVFAPNWPDDYLGTHVFGKKGDLFLWVVKNWPETLLRNS